MILRRRRFQPLPRPILPELEWDDCMTRLQLIRSHWKLLYKRLTDTYAPLENNQHEPWMALCILSNSLAVDYPEVFSAMAPWGWRSLPNGSGRMLAEHPLESARHYVDFCHFFAETKHALQNMDQSVPIDLRNAIQVMLGHFRRLDKTALAMDAIARFGLNWGSDETAQGGFDQRNPQPAHTEAGFDPRVTIDLEKTQLNPRLIKILRALRAEDKENQSPQDQSEVLTNRTEIILITRATGIFLHTAKAKPRPGQLVDMSLEPPVEVVDNHVKLFQRFVKKQMSHKMYNNVVGRQLRNANFNQRCLFYLPKPLFESLRETIEQKVSTPVDTIAENTGARLHAETGQPSKKTFCNIVRESLPSNYESRVWNLAADVLGDVLYRIYQKKVGLGDSEPSASDCNQTTKGFSTRCSISGE